MNNEEQCQGVCCRKNGGPPTIDLLRHVQTLTPEQIREFAQNFAVAGPWEPLENDEDPEHPYWWRPWIVHPNVKSGLDDASAADVAFLKRHWRLDKPDARDQKSPAFLTAQEARDFADRTLTADGVILLDA